MAAPTVTVTGKVLLPNAAGVDGGRIRIRLVVPGAVDDSSTSQTQAIGGERVEAIGSDGSVAFTVVPNAAIAPSGTYYEATFLLPSGSQWTRFWQIPASPASQDIGDLPEVGATPLHPPYLHVTEVDTLPAADASWRGKLVFLRGASGQPDQVLIAVKNADNTYGWTGIGAGL